LGSTGHLRVPAAGPRLLKCDVTALKSGCLRKSNQTQRCDLKRE
jgi:hypothetical protein